MSDLTEIDRLTPAIRPQRRNDGTQKWRSLLFCHWTISFESLRHLVPQELELDSFDGNYYVGLVPFQMKEVCPRWLPASLGFRFYETNVRTYVVHDGKPGVYFFSLDANSRLAVWAARTGWSLPYVYSKMSCGNADGRWSYRARRPSDGEGHNITFEKGDLLGASKPETLEHFLFERYLLFTKRKGAIRCGQVHHAPYEVYKAQLIEFQDSLMKSAGLAIPSSMPGLVHFSPGVDVEVFGY